MPKADILCLWTNQLLPMLCRASGIWHSTVLGQHFPYLIVHFQCQFDQTRTYCLLDKVTNCYIIKCIMLEILHLHVKKSNDLKAVIQMKPQVRQRGGGKYFAVHIHVSFNKDQLMGRNTRANGWIYNSMDVGITYKFIIKAKQAYLGFHILINSNKY